MEDLEIGDKAYDSADQSAHINIYVPPSKIVFLQALFEQYEGVGIVRTLDISRSLVSILTVKDQLATCHEILKDVQEQVLWSDAEGANEIDLII